MSSPSCAAPIARRGRAGAVPDVRRHRRRLRRAADADGIDAVYFVAQENYPVEFLELGYPVRLRTYGIIATPAAPGRCRGGCGIVREYEILAEEAVLAVRIDSVKNPPWGIAGGMAGGVGRAVVNPGTTDERVLAPLSDGNMLQARRHAAHRDRRRRRLRPSVRPAGRGRAGRRAGRLRQPGGGRARIRRRDRDGARSTRPRTAALRAAGRPMQALPPQRICRCLSDPATQRSAVAVDIGGTFTDIALQDAGERPRSGAPRRRACRPIRRRPSWPACGSRSARPGRGRIDVGRVLHGTTVATNMILEGKGAPHGAGHHGGLPPRAHDRPPGHSAPRQLMPG